MEHVDDNLRIARRSEVRDSIVNGESSEYDDVDVLISVCPNGFEQPGGMEYHHFNMADGEYGFQGEHDLSLFQEAVLTLYEALEDNQSVVIHCESAQSRSVAVSAAALALHNEWDMDNICDNIYEIYPRGNIEPSLHPFIERVIIEHRLRA